MSPSRSKLNNGTVLHNQTVHAIPVPEAARVSGKVSPEFIAEAVTYLHRDGIIVLEDAIDESHLETLESMLGPEAEEIARDPNHHFNFGKQTRNMDQAPPLIPEFMYKDVWANQSAISVCSAILGPNPVCHYANGNTALKAQHRQPVHADINRPHPTFPFGYIINIPLSDVAAENGATEIWVGSHRESNISQHTEFTTDGESGLTIRPEILESRRQHSPPIQPSTKRGSVIIRDVRLWHAGMPNRTERPRIMLAFVLQPRWFQAPSKILLPRNVKTLVDQWTAETGMGFAAQWVDGEVDHKTVNSNEVDFSTRNSKMLELEGMMVPPAH